MTPLSGMKIWGWRQSLIGDSVMAIPLLTWADKQWPGSFKYWQVARKCAQAAPLFIDHPLINQIVISDCPEGMGPRDEAIARGCQIRVNTMPQHPDGDVWPNLRGIYFETARMAGLTDTDWNTLPKDQQYPHLYQWFKTERRAKSVAIWPGARQGEKEDRRNPGFTWWHQLATRLSGMGYTVWQCGHPNDMGGMVLPTTNDARYRSFMDLIALSLGCDVAIGTDSGSMVALAAYHSTPTISLLCPHWPGHVENPYAFGPLGKNHTNLWAATNNGHDIEIVVDKVKQLA